LFGRVVEVGVGESDPFQPGRIDELSQSGDEVCGVDDRPGVDQDGLAAVEYEGVDGD
jgi:hypothetical protein